MSILADMMLRYLQENDEELLALVKGDDEKAFNALYKKYWDKLLEVALIKLNNQDDAEEIVQHIFINIWNNRHHIQLKYSFKTYISACLKYGIYAKISSHKKSNTIPIDEGMANIFADNSTQEWLSFNEIREKLETIIVNLPEKCQMVFRLSRESGFSNQEIANELNISEKTVEMHITKAIKTIKSGIKDSNFLFSILFL